MVKTVTGFYNYLESIMPVKRIVISLAVGMVSLFIVLISGLTSDFVREETVASRTFSAFSFTSLTCFIFLMSCEEYAIFKTKRELEHLIEDAELADVETFNREEYLHVEEDEPAKTAEVAEAVDAPESAEDAFRPMNFAPMSNHG